MSGKALSIRKNSTFDHKTIAQLVLNEILNKHCDWLVSCCPGRFPPAVVRDVRMVHIRSECTDSFWIECI